MTFTNSVDVLIETMKGVKRYLNVVNGKGEDNCVGKVICDGNVFTVTFVGHMGETFDLIFWIGNNQELHIENGRVFKGIREEIYEYAEESEWSEEEIKYMKYGNNN